MVALDLTSGLHVLNPFNLVYLGITRLGHSTRCENYGVEFTTTAIYTCILYITYIYIYIYHIWDKT